MTEVSGERYAGGVKLGVILHSLIVIINSMNNEKCKKIKKHLVYNIQLNLMASLC